MTDDDDAASEKSPPVYAVHPASPTDGFTWVSSIVGKNLILEDLRISELTVRVRRPCLMPCYSAGM